MTARKLISLFLSLFFVLQSIGLPVYGACEDCEMSCCQEQIIKSCCSELPAEEPEIKCHQQEENSGKAANCCSKIVELKTANHEAPLASINALDLEQNSIIYTPLVKRFNLFSTRINIAQSQYFLENTSSIPIRHLKSSWAC